MEELAPLDPLFRFEPAKDQQDKEGVDAGKTTQLVDSAPSETPLVSETSKDPSVATITEPHQVSETVPQTARYEKVVLEPTSTIPEIQTSSELLHLITPVSPVEEERSQIQPEGLKRRRAFVSLESVADEEEEEEET